MKKWMILVGLTAVVSNVFSQGKLIGKVFQEDSSALVGASVYLENTKFGTASNSLGKFRLYEIPAGTYTAVFSNVRSRWAAQGSSARPTRA